MNHVIVERCSVQRAPSCCPAAEPSEDLVYTNDRKPYVLVGTLEPMEPMGIHVCKDEIDIAAEKRRVIRSENIKILKRSDDMKIYRNERG